MQEFGLRWIEIDRKDRLVTKEKIFKSQKARDSFEGKVQAKDNFYQIVSRLN